MLATGTFAVGTDAFVVTGFLPEMARTLDVSPQAAGQSVTVFAVAYAVLSPVLATLTARVPRRALLVCALVVLGLANAGSALAPSYGVLVATTVLAASGLPPTRRTQAPRPPPWSGRPSGHEPSRSSSAA